MKLTPLHIGRRWCRSHPQRPGSRRRNHRYKHCRSVPALQNFPGIRPGENTANYIEFVLTRITTIGTIYLAFVALLPEFLLSRTSIPFYLGGTALLIVVVVMIDFITQVQSHLFQHQYEGLLKKTKLKGRR